MNRRLKTVACWMVAVMMLALPAGRALPQQQPGAARQAWTLEEAAAQLQLQPRDAYLQYVVLQLARRANRLGDFSDAVERLIASNADAHRDSVDLFSLFTGAPAVQESLQLDTMRVAANVNSPVGSGLSDAPRLQAKPRARGRSAKSKGRGHGPRRGTTQTPQIVTPTIVSPTEPTGGLRSLLPFRNRPGEVVPVSALSGPTVKSHPWEKMLVGRRPDISTLARSVPEDFYFAEFRTLGHLLDAFDAGDLWGTHLFNQAAREAETLNVGERLKQQLAVETEPALRPFYDLVVEEVAVTGSDPFVREGSDVTLLFRLKQPVIFHARADSFLDAAERAHPDAKRTTGQYLGVEYVQLMSPERDVSVVVADPEPGLHVRSNSLAAFRRVVAAIKGRTEDGRAVRRLGDTPEFAYVRTLMPRGDEREDGLVYLSDPFIRRLVGPELKLTERRRVLCYNHLRMIGHASLLFRTEQGRWPDSLEELARTGTAPGVFGEGVLSCPDGGHYTLSADRTTGVCSRHGHALRLTPNVEIPVREVSGEEANEYRAFVEDYNRYWRIYFDPIAVRLKVTPRQYRVETIILPLIDNSVYTSLAASLGGRPEALDSLPVPRRNIFTAAFRFNKEELLKSFARDFGREMRSGGPPYGFDALSEAKLAEYLSKGLGNQMAFHVYDSRPTFDLNVARLLGLLAASGTGRGQLPLGGLETYIALALASLNSPVYLSFPVRDAAAVDGYLEQLDAAWAALARQGRRGRAFEPEFDFSKYRLTTGQMARVFSLRLDPAKLRLFWARIGGGLYVASKPFILEDLAAMQTGGMTTTPGPRADAAVADADSVGHALARVRAFNWDEVLADYRLGWAENEREACLNNLAPLAGAARALTSRAAGRTGEQTLSGEALERAALELADQLSASHHFCPEGGVYHVSPDGLQVSCSVHGTASDPRQPTAPSERSTASRTMRELSDLTATLTFMEDGLHAVLVVNRK